MNTTVEHAREILLHPKQEWTVIEKEPASVGDLYRTYIAPLAAIGPIAAIIGWSIFGIGVPFAGRYRMPLGGVDVHVFDYDERGRNTHGVAYPHGSLTGTGTLAGRRVRCVAAECFVSRRLTRHRRRTCTTWNASRRSSDSRCRLHIGSTRAPHDHRGRLIFRRTCRPKAGGEHVRPAPRTRARRSAPRLTS